MIIDLSEWLAAERKPPTAEGATVEGPVPPPPLKPKAELEKQAFDACQHKSFAIDDKQRTVKCGECKMWLDPVWCLRELFRYYEQRVDQRLDAIKRFEERQELAKKRRKELKVKPRAEKAATMYEHLQRAAFNEYQAKTLAARAATQRALAGKIEQELTGEDMGEIKP